MYTRGVKLLVEREHAFEALLVQQEADDSEVGWLVGWLVGSLVRWLDD